MELMKVSNMKKVCLVSLGCAKNLVDSEMILAMFPLTSYKLTNSPAGADLIIVNTCGFIEDAKKEAIDTILEMANYDAKLVAVGCFVERNLDELKKAIPEVDLWVPIKEYSSLHTKIGELIGEKDLLPISPLRRIISTSEYSAYLRISDGCDNMCAFCAIPYIRGRMKSRPFDEILEEAHILLDKGIKEISLVSQDPMHYGKDFPSHSPNMLDLMKALDGMGFYSIRLLYLYPEEVTDEEIDFIAHSKSIARYFDVPIQTASDNVLKAMNRHGSVDDMRIFFKKVKEKMPKAVLRTTLIAGFPSESEEDHKETLSFIKEIKFDHLGVFTYSREEGTAAYNRKNQIPEEIKKERYNELMEEQRKIASSLNKERIGEIMEGLVIGYDEMKKMYSLRSYWNAPDGIDGNIFFKADKTLHEGDIVKVKILKAGVYDLLGELTD